MSGLQAAVFQVLEGFTLSDDVRKILEAAYYADDTFAQGRAAGLEEERQRFEAWWMSCDGPALFNGKYIAPGRAQDWTYLDPDVDGAWQGWLARAAISPTSSDAGKDDGNKIQPRNIANEQIGRAARKIVEKLSDSPVSALNNLIQAIQDADAALSSLEAIGKGEKG